MTARERCPECGASDEYTGDLCYSCGYGHMECPRCKEQMSQGSCYSCGLTLGTDGPPPAADVTAETPGIIPPALPGRLGPRREGNILDPVQETLDPTVFLRPDTPEPILKPELRHWIQQTIIKALDKHGYDGMEDWLSLVFTGSLTTYQYSERSDCDVSLFVDTPKFPEWSRAEMIGIMVDACDGQYLPGTTHELQAFVVDTSKLSKDDLYQPGLRSGYDLHTQRWIVPPDKSRVRDVKREQDIDHTYALEVADKMERLIRYEPDKAVRYYKQIHRRRMRDHISGKGDFSQSNVVYKMLDQRGLFDKLRDLGVKIAKVSAYEENTIGPPCPDCGTSMKHPWIDGQTDKTQWQCSSSHEGEDYTTDNVAKRPMVPNDKADVSRRRWVPENDWKSPRERTEEDPTSQDQQHFMSLVELCQKGIAKVIQAGGNPLTQEGVEAVGKHVGWNMDLSWLGRGTDGQGTAEGVDQFKSAFQVAIGSLTGANEGSPGLYQKTDGPRLFNHEEHAGPWAPSQQEVDANPVLQNSPHGLSLDDQAKALPRLEKPEEMGFTEMPEGLGEKIPGWGGNMSKPRGAGPRGQFFCKPCNKNFETPSWDGVRPSTQDWETQGYKGHRPATEVTCPHCNNPAPGPLNEPKFNQYPGGSGSDPRDPALLRNN